jgi:DNA-binding SARP family transcriptional activator
LFRQAQDWDSVARAIKQHALTLFYQGRWQTINDWYSGMPTAIAASDTWLVYWRARALTAGDTLRARGLLEVAFTRFCEANDDVGVFACAMTLWETVMLLGEPWSAYKTWLPVLEAALSRRDGKADAWIEIEGWEAYLLMVVFALGRGALLDEARQVMDRTLRATDRSGNERLAVANDAAILGWASADVLLSEYAVSVISKFVRDEDGAIRRHDRSALLRHWGHYWLALPNWCLGRWEQAIEAFESAMQLATQFRFTAADLSAYCYLSMCYHHIAMPEKASALLREVRAQFSPQRSFHWAMYHFALAYDAYQRDELEQAIEFQLVCMEALRKAEGLSMLAFAWPAEAAYYVQADRLDEAVAVVGTARRATAQTIYCLSDAAHCFVLAEVALRRNNQALAIEHLREGLQHARNPMKAGMLFSMTRCLPGLLSLAIDEGLEADAVAYLIRRWNIVPDVSMQDRWPWPVKIYALGQFRVLVDDVPLPAKGKAHFKVLALLKAIIAGGGRQVSSETLAEWLWPDAEGDTAAASFKVSLHRLRKLLGRDDAVLLHDGKVSLNERVCWVDVWGFEAAIDHAGAETMATNKRQYESQINTLGIYRGYLLPQDDVPWLLGPRERLRAKFQRAALTAGKRQESAKQYDAAAALYERCIEADPSAEGLHCQLMRCLRDAGRRTEGLDAFQRCRRVLAAKLSKETQQVYEALLLM